MAPGKTLPGRSLAEQLADIEDPTPKDFDPEDLDRDGQSSDEEPGKASDINAGREHYQSVGKAKLREQEPIALGKQYAGSHVSRDVLDADSDDDPFAAHTDDDDEADDDDEDDQASSDGLENDASEDEASSSEDSQGIQSHDEQDSDDDVDSDEEQDGLDDMEDDDEESHTDLKKNRRDDRPDKLHIARPQKQDDREELRRLMASDQKTIAATISQAAKADAAKGKAVKEQRTTFDALLNTRIKLQKGLSAINDMSGVIGGDSSEAEEESETIKSAETAAIALWSTLEELRTALSDAHSKEGAKKRKRPSPVTPTATTSSLWERMNNLESESLPHRRSVLDKWSSKVRGTSTSRPNSGGKLLGSASGHQTVTAVLDAQVATEIGDRSSKRARQNAFDSTDQNQPIYDDTVFYQSLLRELVEQRMSSEAISGGLDSLQQLPSRLPIHPITGMRNDKVKRDIDTRASKGRKMRFNVHEKLQNFMAPEDRGSWTGRARDEFFASLLGKTASGLLGEGDDSGSDVESDDDREEGGLRLFRG